MDAAEAVYVDGTRHLRTRPRKPNPPANFAKIWVKAKTSCGTSPDGFAGYSKASQHVFFVRTH